MTLEPTGMEVAVGTFRADITARDGLGRSVIIENQLGLVIMFISARWFSTPWSPRRTSSSG